MAFWPRSAQVSKSVRSTLHVLEPRADLLPPLILRATTAGLTARSAALFSEGTSGLATKVNSSPMKSSILSASTRYIAVCAVLPPTSLVGMHDRRTPNRLQQILIRRLAQLGHVMQYLRYLTSRYAQTP